MKSPQPAIKAVIFDMDGTITRPYLDFARIRREIDCPEGVPILEYLASITDEEHRRSAREKVDRWQREGAEASTLNPGVRETLTFLKERNIPTAVLTRNNRESVDTVMEKHRLSFDVIVTSDDALPPKPSPEPVRHIAERLGLDTHDVMVVGDFRFDVACGREAGARTVYLHNRAEPLDDIDADHVIHELSELTHIITNDAPDHPESGE